MRDLDLKSLRLLVAVCDNQNMKLAAEQAHIEPSAISKRIAQLEQALGTQFHSQSARGAANPGRPSFAGACSSYALHGRSR